MEIGTPPSTCDTRCIHPDAVARARVDLAAGGGALAQMATVFGALGDPTRLRLLTALVGGRLCTCDLANALGVTESAVSHQLRLLKGLGLVSSDREGRVVYHHLLDDHVRELLEVMRAHAVEAMGESA